MYGTDEVFLLYCCCKGAQTLGEDVVVDVKKLNRNTWWQEKYCSVKLARWRERFKSIANDGLV